MGVSSQEPWAAWEPYPDGEGPFWEAAQLVCHVLDSMLSSDGPPKLVCYLTDSLSTWGDCLNGAGSDLLP